jgi:hypothetical protein
MTRRDQAASEVWEIVERIRPILAGHQPEVVGAALADLFAMLLAGHYDPRGPAETDKMREELIAEWLKTARKLIEPNQQMILARARHEGH